MTDQPPNDDDRKDLAHRRGGPFSGDFAELRATLGGSVVAPQMSSPMLDPLVESHPPDARVELRKKLRKRFPEPEDPVDLLEEKVHRHIRQLEGELDRLKAVSRHGEHDSQTPRVDSGSPSVSELRVSLNAIRIPLAGFVREMRERRRNDEGELLDLAVDLQDSVGRCIEVLEDGTLDDDQKLDEARKLAEKLVEAVSQAWQQHGTSVAGLGFAAAVAGLASLFSLSGVGQVAFLAAIAQHFGYKVEDLSKVVAPLAKAIQSKRPPTE